MTFKLNQHDLDILCSEFKLSPSDASELVDRINTTNVTPFRSLYAECDFHVRNGWIAKG